MTYTESFKRDIAIIEGEPGWDKALLVFAYAIVGAMFCMNFDMFRVDRWTPGQVIVFDDAVLVVANAAAFAARRMRVLCPRCNMSNPSSNRYCMNCGTRL